MKNHTRYATAKPFLISALLAAATIPSLAGAALTSSVSPGGALTVTATKRETVVITIAGGQVKINGQNPGSGAANASAITSITVTGSTNGASANTFDLSAVSPADFTALTAVTMDGGGGDDVLIGSAFNDQITGGRGKDLVRGGPGDDTIDGGQQADTAEVTNDADLAVTANTITGLGTDTLSNVENVRLRGGASANRITITGWNGQGTFDGQGGNDTIVDAGDFNVTLTNASLVRSTGRTFSLVAIENAELTGGGGANSYTLSGWAHPATLTGAGGTDTVISSNNADFVLTPTLLQRSGGISITLSSIENANLTGTVAGNSFDVSAWNGGGSLTGTLPGGVLVCSRDANMTLTAGNFTTSAGTAMSHTNLTRATLTGGVSANIINATGYTGSATLNGLGGVDTLTGGSGKDTLISTSGLDVLNGAANDDEYQVDFGAAASLLDSGATTGDHATVSGSSADESLSITATAITRGVETLALGGIDNVSVNQLAGDDAATPTSSSATGFALDGGTQNTQDLLHLDAANNAYILLPGSFQSGANKAITFSNYESYDIANPPNFPFVESTQPDGGSPTPSTTLRFQLRFSADVNGVDAGDLSLVLTGDLALDGPLSVIGGPRDYLVDATLTGTNGTARLDLIDDDSIFADGGVLLGGTGSGNGNFSGGLPYVVDNTPPTVATFTPADASPTAEAVLHFNLSFSEDVTGLTTDLLLPAETGTLAESTISSISGGPRDYTVTVDVGSGAGTLGLDLLDDDTIVDTAGNALDGPGEGMTSSTAVYTVDREAPTVQAITVATVNPTADTIAQFSVIFSEPVTGLDAGNFTFATTGSVSTVLVSLISGGPSVYTIDVDIPGSNLGTVRMDFVDNDAVTDLLGNPVGGIGVANGDFTTGEVLTQDSVDPAAVITRLDASPTSLDQVRYSVAFTEFVAPSFDATDVTVTGSLGATVAVTGTDPNYQVTLTLSNPNADGTVGFTLGTAIQDDLGNTFAGGDAPVYTIDNTLPSPSPSPSVSPSPSPTPSLTASPTGTPAPSISPSPTTIIPLSETPSLTPSPTASPTASATTTATPTASPTTTGTVTPTPTATPSPSPGGTATPTVSISPSPSPTAAPPRQSVVDRLLEITNDSTGLDANNDGRVDAADIGAP